MYERRDFDISQAFLIGYNLAPILPVFPDSQ